MALGAHRMQPSSRPLRAGTRTRRLTALYAQAAEGSAQPRTFVMVKPDGVQRGLTGDIISRMERKGYTLVAMKMQSVPQSQAEQHYQELSNKPFYPKLIEYITSGPVVTMVWSGSGVVEGARALIGSTKPLEAAPGTIRGDFAIDVGRNVVHGSDSEETAQKEISLWFNDDELVSWTPSTSDWIYE